MTTSAAMTLLVRGLGKLLVVADAHFLHDVADFAMDALFPTTRASPGLANSRR